MKIEYSEYHTYHYHTAHLISWERFGKDFLASMISMCLFRTICPKDPQEMDTPVCARSLLWLQASKLTLLNKHRKWTIAKFRMSFQIYLGKNCGNYVSLHDLCLFPPKLCNMLGQKVLTAGLDSKKGVSSFKNLRPWPQMWILMTYAPCKSLAIWPGFAYRISLKR